MSPVPVSPLELERRNRIRLSVAAYAYEKLSESIMSDQAFDELADRINPSVSTGHAVLDRFFFENFDPFTGVWVNKHPDLKGLLRICQEVHKIGLPARRRRK